VARRAAGTTRREDEPARPGHRDGALDHRAPARPRRARPARPRAQQQRRVDDRDRRRRRQSLNYLRLDKGRRIDDKKGRERGESADEKAKLSAEQPITEEERKQQEKEFKQRQTKARARSSGWRAASRTSTSSCATTSRRSTTTRGEAHRPHRHRRGGGRRRRPRRSSATALQRIQAAAVHTLAYGEIERKDGDQSPLIQERQGDFEGMPEGEEKPDEPEPARGDDPNPDVESEGVEEDLDKVRQKMPKLPPLTKDQAQAIMEMTRKIARYGRQQSKARKVLRAGRRGQSDSLALDWRDADVKEDVARTASARRSAPTSPAT
jgi:hypothetical protein